MVVHHVHSDDDDFLVFVASVLLMGSVTDEPYGLYSFFLLYALFGHGMKIPFCIE